MRTATVAMSLSTSAIRGRIASLRCVSALHRAFAKAKEHRGRYGCNYETFSGLPVTAICCLSNSLLISSCCLILLHLDTTRRRPQAVHTFLRARMSRGAYAASGPFTQIYTYSYILIPTPSASSARPKAVPLVSPSRANACTPTWM
jgi:hypothetical protein